MLTTYILGSLALIAKPGPDLMCLLATALSEGRTRAFAMMSGQILGCWLWILLLPLGVATFFTTHPAVMKVVQIVGVCYIGYLAYLTLREAIAEFRFKSCCRTLAVSPTLGTKHEAQSTQHEPRPFVYFRRGVAMAMSNPLTILFFLAFLPHFTTTSSSLSPALQTFLLGSLFCALVPLFDVPVVLTANAFRNRLVHSKTLTAYLKLASGLILVAVVAILAVSAMKSAAA